MTTTDAPISARSVGLTRLTRPLAAIEDNLAWPRGRLGIWVGRAMSVQHRSLTQWALRHVALRAEDQVLDIGCGSGMALELMGRQVTTGRLHGVDRSPEMVALAEHRNSEAVACGRLTARVGDVHQLPYREGVFDVVTATETFYFWRDPDQVLTECHRVLRPGGQLAITLEMTLDAAENPTVLQRVFGRSFTHRSASEGLSIVSSQELRSLMEKADFGSVFVAVEPRRSLGWVTVVGTK